MPTVEQLETQVAQLQQQQAITTRILEAFVEGRLDGADSVKAWLLALDPNLQVDVAPFVFGE